MGRDEPGLGRAVHRLAGDLTVLADGRLALVTPDEEVHDSGTCSPPSSARRGTGCRVPPGRGDRHVGRVRLAIEVIDRHERLNDDGMVAFGSGRAPE